MQKLQRFNKYCRRKMYRVSEKLKCPDPRHRPERYLETAGPVDPHSRRILLHPAIQVVNEGLGEDLVARQHISHAEGEKMLVAVQFPDNLAIARFRRTKLVKLFPMFE